MMKRKNYLEFILLPLFLSTAATQVCALTQITGDMTVTCNQSKSRQELSCDYRNRSAEPILSITAEYANTSLHVDSTKEIVTRNKMISLRYCFW